MSYASGKHAYGISDRSGRRYRLREMKTEWTGAKVGPDEFEPKHPQLFPPRAFPDPQALRDPRPDKKETVQAFVGVPLVENPNLVVPRMVGQVGEVEVTTNESLVSFSVTGVSAAGSVGSVEVIAQAVFVTTSSLSSTGEVGTVTIPNESVSVSGVSAAASVSSVSVGGDISVTVTGLSGISSVGSVSLVMDVTITLTGLGATGSVGAVTVSAGGAWALASGSWNDSGVWSDSANWNDGS